MGGVADRSHRLGGVARCVPRPGSPLSGRLAIVQRLIGDALDTTVGEVRVISICSGAGKDLLGVLAGRDDRARVHALLVEADPARRAGPDRRARRRRARRRRRGRRGAHRCLRRRRSRRPRPRCGVFGNIADEDVERTIGALPQLCAARVPMIWTRHRGHPDLTPAVRRWFADAGLRRARVRVGRPRLVRRRHAPPRPARPSRWSQAPAPLHLPPLDQRRPTRATPGSRHPSSGEKSSYQGRRRTSGSRRAQADHLVGAGRSTSHASGDGDGHGHDDPRRVLLAQRLARPPASSSRWPARRRRRSPSGPPVAAGAAPPRYAARGAPARGSSCLDRLDPARPGCRRTRPAPVDDADAAARDRPHGVLLVPGHAELAHEEDVQRCVQRPRDLGRHGHAAARQPEDDHVVAPRVRSSRAASARPASTRSANRRSLARRLMTRHRTPCISTTARPAL